MNRAVEKSTAGRLVGLMKLVSLQFTNLSLISLIKGRAIFNTFPINILEEQHHFHSSQSSCLFILKDLVGELKLILIQDRATEEKIGV